MVQRVNALRDCWEIHFRAVHVLQINVPYHGRVQIHRFALEDVVSIDVTTLFVGSELPVMQQTESVYANQISLVILTFYVCHVSVFFYCHCRLFFYQFDWTMFMLCLFY